MEAVRLFDSVGRPAVLLLGALGVAAVGALDLATGTGLSVSPLHLAPVSFVSWRLGRREGTAFALLSTAACLAAAPLPRLELAGILAGAWNLGAQAGVFLVVSLLVAGLRERLEREWTLVRNDDLTGLANLHAFRERAILEVERSRRWRRPLTIAHVELEDFRALNEEFGHDVGDEILRTVAVSLRSAVRSTDLAARVGGDDFVLLLPETDRRGAQVILEKCLHRLQQDMARGGWPVTVSLGSISSIEAVDGESLSRQADQLLAQVKGAGKAANRAGSAAPASPIP
jgi:diguanylate cyclase (GGDEF)-like protein